MFILLSLYSFSISYDVSTLKDRVINLSNTNTNNQYSKPKKHDFSTEIHIDGNDSSILPTITPTPFIHITTPYSTFSNITTMPINTTPYSKIPANPIEFMNKFSDSLKSVKIDSNTASNRTEYNMSDAASNLENNPYEFVPEPTNSMTTSAPSLLGF